MHPCSPSSEQWRSRAAGLVHVPPPRHPATVPADDFFRLLESWARGIYLFLRIAFDEAPVPPSGELTGVDLNQPFAWIAATALAAFAAYLVKDIISDLRKQRDASDARVVTLTKAVEELTDAVKDGFRGVGR